MDAQADLGLRCPHMPGDTVLLCVAYMLDIQRKSGLLFVCLIISELVVLTKKDKLNDKGHFLFRAFSAKVQHLTQPYLKI